MSGKGRASFAEPDDGYPHVYPWDATLHEIRRTAHRVAWVEQRMEELLQRERELAHEADYFDARLIAIRGEIHEWMKESRNERKHLTLTSARAIQAGFAERIVHHAEIEARTIARVLGQALDVLDLTDDEKIRAARALRMALEDVSVERGYATARTVRGELDDGNQATG